MKYVVSCKLAKPNWRSGFRVRSLRQLSDTKQGTHEDLVMGQKVPEAQIGIGTSRIAVTMMKWFDKVRALDLCTFPVDFIDIRR